MKTLTALTVATLLIAAPAYAQQGGWTSNDYGTGTTYYNGTGSNRGWSGTANDYGTGTTYYHFNGPHGQQQTCHTNDYGTGTTYTNCN